jgi:hypothetical protein
MNKEHILKEIRRTAEANGGTPLGQDRFFKETGIKHSDWFGKYWSHWNKAVSEAGFSPNELQTAYDEKMLLDVYIAFVQELGHLPVEGEMRLKTRKTPTFPNSKTYYTRYGSKMGLIKRLISYCENRPDCGDVLRLCQEYEPQNEKDAEVSKNGEENIGFVYLMKSGRNYKIGRTNALGRREYEFAIQLPEKATTVHVIKTDDPAGIEAYWHKRFEAARKNGEWFELTADQVSAFKRRKFM